MGLCYTTVGREQLYAKLVPQCGSKQGRTQDLTKGGAHAHAQIIDGCGLSYCTRTRSETLQILQQDIQLDYKLLWAGQWL